MGLLDQIEQSRRGLLDNVAQKQLERGLLGQFNDQMTHQPGPQNFMPEPVGNYLNKVISGGYLKRLH